MTDDPIRRAAEALALDVMKRLALRMLEKTNRPPFAAIAADISAVIEAAFRQQRAEAERECEEMRKGWRYTEHRAEAAEQEVSRLRAALKAIATWVRDSDCCYGGSCIAGQVEEKLAALQVGEAIP